MPNRDKIEATLRHWRDAERRLELASGRDAEVIEREVAYYRSMFQTLCAAQTDAAMAELREAEEHRALDLSGPTTTGSN